MAYRRHRGKAWPTSQFSTGTRAQDARTRTRAHVLVLNFPPDGERRPALVIFISSLTATFTNHDTTYGIVESLKLIYCTQYMA